MAISNTFASRRLQEIYEQMMHAKVGRASAGSDLVTSGSGIVSQLSGLHRASKPARQGRSVVSVRCLRDPSCAHSGLTVCPRAPRQAAVIFSGSQTRTIPYVEKSCKQWCNWAQTTMHLAHRIDGSIQLLYRLIGLRRTVGSCPTV